MTASERRRLRAEIDQGVRAQLLRAYGQGWRRVVERNYSVHINPEAVLLVRYGARLEGGK